MTDISVRGQSGFTLLELLVALVILGFIISGLAGSTKLGFTSLGTQSRVLAERQDLEPVDRLLRRLVAAAALPDDARQPGLVGHRTGFACLTQLSMAQTRDPAADRVDATVTSDNAHQLVLSWSPHIHAQRLLPRPPPKLEILLRGIDRLDVSYLSPDRHGWWAEWSRTDLPALIRIQLVFAPDDPRHWPPIIAATRHGRFLDLPNG